jgi:hypothetical protein
MRDNSGMTPEEQERFHRIEETLEYVVMAQRSHDDQIGRLVEQVDRLVERADKNERLVAALAERSAVLTERSIQMMDAINRLAHIAAGHDERLDKLENPGQ